MVALDAPEVSAVWKSIKFAWKIVLPLVALVAIGFLIISHCEPRTAPGDRRATSKGAKAPEGWTIVPDVEPPSGPAALNPLRKKTEAENELAGMPAGARVAKIETEGGDTIRIGVLPSGEIIVPEGQQGIKNIVVYHKPPPWAALEARPWIGGGLGLSPAARDRGDENDAATIRPEVLAGVDGLRIGTKKPVHLGAGASWSSEAGIGLVTRAGWQILGNLDVGAHLGYNRLGVEVGAHAAVALR